MLFAGRQNAKAPIEVHGCTTDPPSTNREQRIVSRLQDNMGKDEWVGEGRQRSSHRE